MQHLGEGYAMALQLDAIDIHRPQRYAEQGFPWAEWDLLRREAPVFWYERDDIEPFWAVTRYNDVMAIGAIAVLSEHGVRIPQDIAIAGFDDIDVAAYTIPPLTTLQQPRRQMGKQAMQRLLALIRQETAAGPQSTKMLGQLVIRKST